MEKTRITLRINGKDYNLTSSDSEEYVRRVGAYVDRKITELGMAARMSAMDLAVLTAVNLADDLMKSHDEINRLRRELDEAHEENERLARELKA